jgi:general secretion pathway protein D
MIQPPLHRSIATLLAVSMLSTPIAAFAQVESAVQRELRRRYDYESRGNAAVLEGEKFMKQRDYAKAHAAYKQAVTLIPNSANTAASWERAVEKFGESCGKLAEQRIAEGRYADAEMILRDLLDNYDPKNKQAVVILSRLEMPDYYNKTLTPKFVGNVEQVKQWFLDAEGYYNSGRFDLAFKRCEQILNTDPYNIAAQQMKEKIDRAMSDAHLAGYNETRARAMREIDKAWVRPIRKFNIVTETGPIDQGTQTSGNIARIQKKLERIIIPTLEFKEATIREAVDFLKKKSKDLDTTEEREEDRGVNIVLKLEGAGGGSAPMPEMAAPVAPAIPGLEPLPGAAPLAAPMAAPMPTVNPGDARISISLTNIPLIEALKYVTGLANLKYKVEPYAVSIVPQSVNIDTVYTKEWKVRPDLISRTPGGGGGGLEAPAAAPADATRGGTGIGAREAAKDWLIAQGVTFGANASAIYIPTSSKLIVRNTQEMLDLIDQIIESSAGSGPVQIDIEAKFVEITQNNLKELSFDWLLGGFNIGGRGQTSVFGAGGTAGTAPGLDPQDFPFVAGGAPVGQNPLTAGNRSGQLAISANAIDALLFGLAGTTPRAPGIFGVAGAFTDPTFQVVIRALNQKKGVDLLSAPRVTTKSGQRAVIEIIREFRYPTEFDPPQIPQNFGNQNNQVSIIPGATGAGASSFPVTPTTPTAFETRNTGVTLEVEPVIGPDGYTIDLNLVPQVVEFEGFINYGSPIQSSATNPITGVTTTNVITPNVINQPIFSTRKVTTSVSIFDGQTVVLGGLMREDIQKVEDKVPLLGDIPLVGRLFRSSVDQHLKRNLIIFVSARLMNPAGDPVRSEEEPEEVVETLPAPEISLPNELPLMPK